MRRTTLRTTNYRKFRIRAAEALEPRLVLAPVINEFMATNDSSFVDGDGQDSDWIEIYNPTTSAIDLTGWHLTDNADNLDKWTFQPHISSVLDPGEYLIVVASGQTVETYIDSAGYAHTDFKLSAGGEYLGLTDPDLTIIDVRYRGPFLGVVRAYLWHFLLAVRELLPGMIKVLSGSGM